MNNSYIHTYTLTTLFTDRTHTHVLKSYIVYFFKKCQLAHSYGCFVQGSTIESVSAQNKTYRLNIDSSVIHEANFQHLNAWDMVRQMFG